jgi:KDO2-lipid IV(A) lauroyltransferase
MVGKKATSSHPVLASTAIGLLRLWARLPLAWVRAFGWCIGSLADLLPLRPRRITELNVTHCLADLDARAQRRVIRQSLIETARTYAEFGAMWEWPPERLQALELGVENEALLQDGMAAGRGLILLVPHIGNWELMLHYLTRHHPTTVLFRPPRIAELDGYLRETRKRSGATVAPATPQGLRSLLRGLGSGGLVGILPDQEPLKENGVWAPFFGYPALTMTLVAALLRRYEAGLVFGYARRERHGFRLCFRPAPDGMDDADDVRAATALNRGVETCVRECAEQYLWSYKRFRTRQPADRSAGGEPRRIIEYPHV